MLELEALDIARNQLKPKRLEELLAANRPGRGNDLPTIDNDLHRYWIERSRNRYILDFHDRHGRFYKLLYEVAAVGKDALDQIARQHRVILEALLARKWKQAREALREDLISLGPILQEGVERILADDS